jgi:uncharacterized protein YbaR (Trm112 family)
MDSATEMDKLTTQLRCPRTGQPLHAEDGRLVTEDGLVAYRVEDGIPVLLPGEAMEVNS